MNEFIAPLGLKIDASEVAPATVSLDQLAKAGGRAETAANDLAGASRKLSTAEANVAAEAQKAMSATVHLAAEQEALVKTQNRLNEAHGKVVNNSKVLQQTTLNLSRQVTDIGVQLAGGQNPFLVLTQQLPQVADGFAVAAQQGLGFKAVIKGMAAEATGLLVTFGPWVAGLAAVAAGVWYVVNAHKEQVKAIDDTTKRLEAQRAALGKISPLLVQAKNDADLAADGQRNFDEWIRKTNVSLADQIRLQRIKTLNDTNTAALKATEELQKAQADFDRINKAGSRAGFSTGVGAFSTISAATSVNKESELYKKAAANLKKAQEDADAVQRRLAQQGQAPDPAFGKQTEAATRATTAAWAQTKAVEEQVKQIGLLTGTVQADGETWSEYAAVVHASDLKTRDLASAQQDLNRILATDRPATALENLIAELDKSRAAANEVAYAVEDIFYSISRNDWAGAFSGLLRTIDLVTKAFGQAATAKSKMEAIAGVGMGVGSAVGGTAGAGISGAASGALGGFSLVSSLAAAGTVIPGIGNIAGAAIGAAIGGLGALFGSSSAKKKAKAEAEAQRLAAEQARIQEIANQKRSLEIALMEAQGWSFVALTASRADELAKMDASNRAYAEAVYAAQDAAKTKELEIQLLEATGQAAAALSIRRHQELATLSETDQAIKKAIWAAEDQTKAATELADAQAKAAAEAQALADAQTKAAEAAAAAAAQAAQATADLNSARQNDAATLVANARSALTSAYEAEASAIEATRGKFQGFADDLKAFRLSLSGSAGSAGSDFFALAAKARLGDADALGQLVSAGTAADAAAKAGARTQQDYLIEQAKIRNAVQAAEDTANRQASIADQQLDALKAQVSGLIAVNDSVLSVAAAIAGLQSALGVQNGTFGGAVANPNRNWGANPDTNMLLAREGYDGDFGGGGFQAWAEQLPESAKATLRQILTAQGQSYRIAFASGGSMKVGGDGGTDTTAVNIAATRGEVVYVSKGDVMADVVAELRALRAEVAALRGDGEKTARYTEKTANTLVRVTRDGNALLTEAA